MVSLIDLIRYSLDCLNTGIPDNEKSEKWLPAEEARVNGHGGRINGVAVLTGKRGMRDGGILKSDCYNGGKGSIKVRTHGVIFRKT